ncbi:hypothetical protein EV191_12357 [Tamaricihabitans halophyticus]|uniref:CBS domain-containing protein n=2 Tax=Tamaricihabitans halophyticus TaxID=1262583 RepID=A0A4R2Q2A2_9PSEU|nr:hypothetical protein EV191_12357 [Tamaricihabitans halophyticus]
MSRPLSSPGRQANRMVAPLHQALSQIRRAGEQLVAVLRHDRFVGVVTLADVLRHVLPAPDANALTHGA